MGDSGGKVIRCVASLKRTVCKGIRLVVYGSMNWWRTLRPHDCICVLHHYMFIFYYSHFKIAYHSVRSPLPSAIVQDFPFQWTWFSILVTHAWWVHTIVLCRLLLILILGFRFTSSNRSFIGLISERFFSPMKYGGFLWNFIEISLPTTAIHGRGPRCSRPFCSARSTSRSSRGRRPRPAFLRSWRRRGGGSLRWNWTCWSTWRDLAGNGSKAWNKWWYDGDMMS